MCGNKAGRGSGLAVQLRFPRAQMSSFPPRGAFLDTSFHSDGASECAQWNIFSAFKRKEILAWVVWLSSLRILVGAAPFPIRPLHHIPTSCQYARWEAVGDGLSSWAVIPGKTAGLPFQLPVSAWPTLQAARIWESAQRMHCLCLSFASQINKSDRKLFLRRSPDMGYKADEL